MATRPCPPDCDHCERIAEERADGDNYTQSDRDYFADREADRYERGMYQ